MDLTRWPISSPLWPGPCSRANPPFSEENTIHWQQKQDRTRLLHLRPVPTFAQPCNPGLSHLATLSLHFPSVVEWIPGADPSTLRSSGEEGPGLGWLPLARANGGNCASVPCQLPCDLLRSLPRSSSGLRPCPMELGGGVAEPTPGLVCPVPSRLPRPGSPEPPPRPSSCLLLGSRAAGHLAAWMCGGRQVWAE